MTDVETHEAHKSDIMMQFAVEKGWQAVVTVDVSEFEISGKPDDIIWKLLAKREALLGDETLIVHWSGDSQQKATYNYGDYWLYPAWRGGVIKLIEGKADPKKFSKRDKGKFSEDTYDVAMLEREVPFDDDAPAFDILKAVLDRTVTWYRKMEGKEHQEFVPKVSNLGKSYFKLRTTAEGKRVLEWANNWGFHACYVKDIIRVD